MVTLYGSVHRIKSSKTLYHLRFHSGGQRAKGWNLTQKCDVDDGDVGVGDVDDDDDVDDGDGDDGDGDGDGDGDVDGDDDGDGDVMQSSFTYLTPWYPLNPSIRMVYRPNLLTGSRSLPKVHLHT